MSLAALRCQVGPPRRPSALLFFCMAVMAGAVLFLAGLSFTAAQDDMRHFVLWAPSDRNGTRSITFLSSGYTEPLAFHLDAQRCVDILRGTDGDVNADPWPRYLPFFSIDGVFQASPQAGASRPHGRLHDCRWMKECSGPAVRNNLGCEFGTPNPHFMGCDIRRVVAMADVVEKQDIVIVLINDPDAGGVASNGVVYITNSLEFMPFMLVHYLNRAVANLHAEYNLGLSVPAAVAAEYVAPNCAVSRAAAQEKWSHWFAADPAAQDGAAVTALAARCASEAECGSATGDKVHVHVHDHVHHAHESHVGMMGPWNSVQAAIGGSKSLPHLRSNSSLAPPPLSSDALGAGCSFSNFIAPGENACMMRNSSINYMCNVCREQLSLSFFANGVSGSIFPNRMTYQLNLAAGKCPPGSVATYVEFDPLTGKLTSPLYLSAGDALATSDMEVTWTLDDPGGPVVIARSTAFLLLEGTALSTWILPATVTATIRDSNPYVREEMRNAPGSGFVANAIFIVARRTNITNCWSTIPGCYGENGAAASTCLASPPFDQPDDLTNASRVATPRIATPRDAADLLGTAPEPVYNTRSVIIVACITGGVAIILLMVLFAVHGVHVRRRPREVLNLQLLDRVLHVSLIPCCVVDLAIAVLVLVFVIAFIPAELFRGLQMMIASVVLGAVVYLISIFNLCSVLFRWYPVSMTCCVLLYLLSLGFFALGIVALWAHFNQDAPGLSDTLATLWVNTLQKDTSGNRYICSLQYHLSCSGFHTGCFMTNSTECPLGCGANFFVNACQVPFLGFIGEKYLPVGILTIIGGFFFVITATLDTLFFMRFRQLSRTGRLRRGFRKDPHAPVVPITHHECDTVREMFRRVCAQPALTLQGKHAVHFLERVFGERLPNVEQDAIAGLGPLTFDELMTVYFPYVVSAAADPRMLTPDEAEEARDMADLQRRQYAKLQEYARAAGALSPEALHNLFEHYTQRRFLPRIGELLTAIRAEAAACADAPMCRGLSPMELEGLRASWVALHPSVAGHLTRAEVRTFYEWCHGVSLPSDGRALAALDAWIARLAVREPGTVGWAEFCYPYAQRALLREARSYLAAEEKEIPPELLTRQSAAAKFGEAVVEQCFLPYEREIPIERLVAYLLQHKSRAAEPDPSPPQASAGSSRGGATAKKCGQQTTRVEPSAPSPSLPSSCLSSQARPPGS